MLDLEHNFFNHKPIFNMKRKFTTKGLLPLILVMFVSLTHAQSKIIELKGKVVSSTNDESLPGVEIMLTNKKASTLTDNNGEFSIKVPINDTLVFRYMGFKPRRYIADGSRNFVSIKLTEDVNELDQVVVIGYGTEKRKDVTGSVTSIKAEQLADATAVSFSDALRGKAAGVQVTSSSGEPGAGVSIKIRGNNSISASSDPLYVVDGVPIESNPNEIYAGGAPQSTTVGNPLAYLNPNDIESIEILKDASAAAIYGSRGANGVIIITTKTPKKGEPNISFSSNFSYSTYNFNKMKVLGPADYAENMRKIDPTNPLYTDQDTGEPIIYTDADGMNWQKALTQSPINQNYNISLSKSTDKTKYYTSLGYNTTDGLVKESNFKRYSFLLNLNSDLTSKLNLDFKINTGYTILNGQISGSGQGPNAGLVNRILLSRPINFNIPSEDETDDTYTSPVSYVKNTDKIYNTLRNSLNTSLTYDFSKFLSLKVAVGGYISGSDNTTYMGREVAQGRNLNGLAVLGNVKTINWLNENTLNYKRYFNETNRLDVLLGYTMQQNTLNSSTIEVNNFPIEINKADAIQTALSAPSYSSNKQRWSLISYLGRANYSINGKYLFTASLRADGSSKFQGNNKYSFFPAAAFAWQIGDEDAIKNLNVFDQFKLRLSYGSIGNQGIPSYSSIGTATISDYYTGSILIKGVNEKSISNPDLKWETTTTTNIGLDLGFFKNRLSLSTDIYNKDTKNLLLNAPLPGSSGFDRVFKNVGSLNNKGIEISLNGTIIKNRNFKWDVDLNYSINKNKITYLGSQSEIPFGSVAGSSSSESINILKVGYSSTSLYGYVADGVYQASDFDEGGQILPGVPVFGNPMPGNMKFKDISGPNGVPDGLINTYDLKVIGDATPNSYGGVRNTFRYKNLRLSVFVAFQEGNQIENWNMYHLGGRISNNLLVDLYKNSWTPTNTNTKIPILSDNTGKAVASSYYVQDASFIRLQNVQLSYNLPSKLNKALGISNCTLTASADNLLILTNYKYGFDPEITSNNPSVYGVDFFNYPRPKSFSMGLNVKF